MSKDEVHCRSRISFQKFLFKNKLNSDAVIGYNTTSMLLCPFRLFFPELSAVVFSLHVFHFSIFLIYSEKFIAPFSGQMTTSYDDGFFRVSFLCASALKKSPNCSLNENFHTTLFSLTHSPSWWFTFYLLMKIYTFKWKSVGRFHVTKAVFMIVNQTEKLLLISSYFWRLIYLRTKVDVSSM